MSVGGKRKSAGTKNCRNADADTNATTAADTSATIDFTYSLNRSQIYQ